MADEEGFTYDETDVRALMRHWLEQHGENVSFNKAKAMVEKYVGWTSVDFAAMRAADEYLFKELAKVPHKPTGKMGDVLSRDVLEKGVAILQSKVLQGIGR